MDSDLAAKTAIKVAKDMTLAAVDVMENNSHVSKEDMTSSLAKITWLAFYSWNIVNMIRLGFFTAEELKETMVAAQSTMERLADNEETVH